MTRIALVVAVICVGCAAPTEPLTLDFPSRDAFVRSTSAEVFVVPTADLDACPELLAEAESGGLTMESSTGSQSVCDFRAGIVEYPEVPEGANAYVAIVRDDAGEVLLSGCVVRNVYLDDPTTTVLLTPTDKYRMDFGSAPMETCTVEQRCGGGCR